MPTMEAAALIFPVSATATKYRIWRNVTEAMNRWGPWSD
jgi:hypothetical protein